MPKRILTPIARALRRYALYRDEDLPLAIMEALALCAETQAIRDACARAIRGCTCETRGTRHTSASRNCAHTRVPFVCGRSAKWNPFRDIVGIDPSVVKALQDDQFIPVISPIGFGEHNESYNINADVVAAKLATVLKAEKLVMLTNIKGVLNKAGELITELTPRQIDELIEDGTISGGMLPKLAGAIDAAKSGVNAVHVVDGRVPHAMLLEILTDQAYGTMIRSH